MNVDKRIVDSEQTLKHIEESIRADTTSDPEILKKAMHEVENGKEFLGRAWKQRWIMHDALQQLNSGEDVDNEGYSVKYGQALVEAKALVKSANHSAEVASTHHKDAKEHGSPMVKENSEDKEASTELVL